MHVLPKLDYSYAALEPHIDAKTMEIHYLAAFWNVVNWKEVEKQFAAANKKV